MGGSPVRAYDCRSQSGGGSMTLKDPATYAGEFVCMRCGSGWPLPADTRPDGTKYTHAETCQKYIDAGQWSYGYRICGDCAHELATELMEEV